MELEIDFALDRNPDEACCKLLFTERGGDPSPRGGRRLGYMLLAAGDDASLLRGMHICEAKRGQGLSKVLLAVWLRLCAEAAIVPRTKTINKPLLSLTLERFGFAPLDGVGQVVRVHAGTRRLKNCRGWQDERGAPDGAVRVARVRTNFHVTDRASCDAEVAAVLGADHERLTLEADGAALRRALTLRGGAACDSGLPQWHAHCRWERGRKPTPRGRSSHGGA